VVSLLAVVVLLTQTLVTVFGEVSTSKAIETVLNTELAKKPSTSLFNFEFKLHKAQNALDVLAIVKTPKALDPREVKTLQDRIQQALGYETTLITSCVLVKDVSAHGSSSAVISTNLNGEFIARDLPTQIARFQLAEQTLREILEEHPGMSLSEVDLIDLETGPVLLATIKGPRKLKPSMVADFEQRIQRRLLDYQVRLLVRSEVLSGISSKGPVLLGVAHFNRYSSKELEEQFRLEEAARAELQKTPNLVVIGLDAVQEREGWRILAETVGANVITPQQVRAVQNRLSASFKLPVQLHLIYRTDVMIDAERYYSNDIDSER
jgi:hypothetical protein